ncbi:MAG: D-sedoheptulose 7-phosphate isomerase [Hymenobacteraceae bacterium]|nr:D-sedoheptulose 7-phosphate isomerase [Hymenobacteraceae bacterium]MDX5397343.1 D-sedoheptulose 7-phosphate isomerase [Hymenobacteraceae bacterium]MDX5442689.1 D-sedoheptulose 7-phosphate isomerase [Hymenobacteraceae bacterium]MDX5513422.1 D-sedoheptulose 7-phosphate isomerase [Hymenobacteraceae bacterium]
MNFITTELVLAELSEAQRVLQQFLAEPAHIEAITAAATLLATAVKQKGKLLSCGNGGSMCDAMHFAEELTGRFRENRPAIPAIALSDVSHMSCVGNDYGYDFVFSRAVEALGQPQDVLIAISTSGNSGNVIKAAEAAKAKGMKVLGLTGKDGGKLAPLCDVEIRVPHFGFADRVQEIHIKVIHILILLLEKALFETGATA